MYGEKKGFVRKSKLVCSLFDRGEKRIRKGKETGDLSVVFSIGEKRIPGEKDSGRLVCSLFDRGEKDSGRLVCSLFDRGDFSRKGLRKDYRLFGKRKDTYPFGVVSLRGTT